MEQMSYVLAKLAGIMQRAARGTKDEADWDFTETAAPGIALEI